MHDAENVTSSEWVALTGLAVVEVAGSEAEAFLQGQFCNDLGALSPTGVQLNGYCSPKGRLLAIFRVIRLDGGRFRLLLPAVQAESLLKRLRMFVLRADVSFTLDTSVATRTLLLAEGETADLALPAVANSLITMVDGDGQTECQILRLEDQHAGSGSQARYLELAAVAGELPVQEAASAASELDEYWRLGEIQAGVPNVFPATQERFVPQMVNMGPLGGLSFHKGCYPGQEIVARMQYRGKQKRFMYRYRLDARAALPARGELVPAEGDCPDAEIVDVARAAAGHAELLAVVRSATDGSEGPPLMWQGQGLEPLPLPYVPDSRES